MPPRDPRYASYYSVRGSSDADIWVAGYYPLHWDGQTWTEVVQDVDRFIAFSPTEVYAVGGGSLRKYAGGSTWTYVLGNGVGGVSARSPTSMLARGTDPSNSDRYWKRLHNTQWDLVAVEQYRNAQPQVGPFVSVSDVEAWGVGGAIVHRYDGSLWTWKQLENVPVLSSLWTDGQGGVWVAGAGGTIISRNNGQWTPENSGVTVDLHDIHGTPNGDMWAVGAFGTVLRRVAGVWTPVPSGVTASLNNVWISPGGVVWIAGDEGTILRGTGFGVSTSGSSSSSSGGASSSSSGGLSTAGTTCTNTSPETAAPINEGQATPFTTCFQASDVLSKDYWFKLDHPAAKDERYGAATTGLSVAGALRVSVKVGTTVANTGTGPRLDLNDACFDLPEAGDRSCTTLGLTSAAPQVYVVLNLNDLGTQSGTITLTRHLAP
jgi:hypothetical protein